ncbi:MAG: T9SS type A sorting domain-containing protein [Bacteroidetes bacterium]|nr:T9SS type A sorting domain-containing protein [Bacteroidota bacterium]
MNKHLVILLTGLMFTKFLPAQTTATNFSVKDCAGLQYTLFDELNAGKVVVLTWTMPCGSCVLPLKTTYNVVQSFQNSHPGMVQMILADDYANTSCSSIDLWANSNGLTNTRRFSNPAIRMLDYGSNGMPKVVVVGGPDKTVFYNANDAVDHVALQSAIQQAISVVTALDPPQPVMGIRISYQAVNHSIEITGLPAMDSDIVLEIVSLQGRMVYRGQLARIHGHSASFKLPGLPPAIYVARVKYDGQNQQTKFVVE